MPISLADFENDRGTCEIVYRGLKLDRVVYNPSVITGPMTAEVTKITEAQGEAAGLAYGLSRLVLEWDLLDGGAMYPLTPEALGKLPTPFLWAVFGGIKTHMAPAKDERKN